MNGMTNNEVSLQVQMILGSEGNLLNKTTDITMKLKYPSGYTDVVMWEKVYSNITLVDGVLNINLKGVDDTNRTLVAEMFDQARCEFRCGRGWK